MREERGSRDLFELALVASVDRCGGLEEGKGTLLCNKGHCLGFQVRFYQLFLLRPRQPLRDGAHARPRLDLPLPLPPIILDQLHRTRNQRRRPLRLQMRCEWM